MTMRSHRLWRVPAGDQESAECFAGMVQAAITIRLDTSPGLASVCGLTLRMSW